MTVAATPDVVIPMGGAVRVTTASGTVYAFWPADDGGWWYTRRVEQGAPDLIGYRPTTWIPAPPRFGRGMKMLFDGIISTPIKKVEVLP